jgi:hypothetical protein
MSATETVAAAKAVSAGKSVPPTPTMAAAPSHGKTGGGKRQSNYHHHHELLHFGLLPPWFFADLLCGGATISCLCN